MPKPDTLLLVTTSYPQDGDGSEAAGSFVADLAEALGAHCPLRVVAPGRVDRVDSTRLGVTVYRYRSPSAPLSLHSPMKPWHWYTILRTMLAMRRAVFRADKDGQVMHTLALWALPSGYWARALMRAKGVPYSVWVLGSDIWSLGRIPLVRQVLAKILKGAEERFSDGIVLGQDAAKIASRPFEFLPSTRRISVRREQQLRDQPPYRLLFLGRWHANKGPDLFLDALSQLSADDWQRISGVEVFGGGPMHAEIHEKTARLGQFGHPVMVGGFLPKRDAELAMLRADYLVIPSRIESIPVIFSDAMKLGCPVICTAVGDLPRLVSDFDVGVVAAHATSEAFVLALQKALRRAPLDFDQGIRRAAQRFDLESGVVGPLLAAIRASPPAINAEAKAQR